MEEIRTLLKNEILPSTKRVLEVGCGSGIFLRELAEAFPETLFCGIDPYAPELTKDNLRLKRGYGEEVNIISGWFDLIFSIHSFHHLSDPQTFLENSGKKLSPGGILLIFDWKEGANTGIPETYYSIEKVKSLIYETGLKIERAESLRDNFLITAKRKSFKVAVATDDGVNITEGMFGRAKYFYIYSFDGNEFILLEKRENIYRDTFQHLKTFDVYSLVNDCNPIITGKIGKKGEARLKGIGVRIIKSSGKIEDTFPRLPDLLRLR